MALGRRNTRLAVLACGCAIGVAGAVAARAGAHPPVPLTTDGHEITGRLHRWLHQAKVPLVDGRITIVPRVCPGAHRYMACIRTRRPRRIYLPRHMPRSVFYHELGHVFDMLVLNQRERVRFKRIMHVRNRRWFGRRRPVAEWFADGYSLCARRRTIGRRPRATPYGYRPTRSQHRAVCALVWQAAAPRGAPPQRPPRPPATTDPPTHTASQQPLPPASSRPPCSLLDALLGRC